MDEAQYTQPGDRIKASTVRAMAQARNAGRLNPGFGTFLTDLGPMGAAYSAMPGPGAKMHAWKVTIRGTGAFVATGLCNQEVPWIDGRRMDGRDENGKLLDEGAPYLELDLSRYDDTGRSWICLRVKVGPNGKLLPVKEGGLEILQFANIGLIDGGSEDVDGRGLESLAMLIRPPKSQSVGRVVQDRYFNIKHYFKFGTGGRPGRHFFA